MNEVVKNAQSFIEVLQSTSSNIVEDWDSTALHRVLMWARYCEEVYSKLKNKPNTVEQMNKKLKLICCIPGAAIGKNIYSLQDFNQSRRLLLKNLIQNPSLPSNLFGEVLEQYNNLKKNTNTGLDPFIQDASEIIQAKSSRICLQQTLQKAVQEKHLEADHMDQELKEEQRNILNARLLKQFLVHHHRNSPQKTNEYLDQILHSAASQLNGMHIIAMTISLPTENDEVENDSDNVEKQYIDACEQFIFDWIQKNKTTYLMHVKDEGTEEPGM